jgi:hypothetical protein
MKTLKKLVQERFTTTKRRHCRTDRERQLKDKTRQISKHVFAAKKKKLFFKNFFLALRVTSCHLLLI